jgi:hypothetical protein
MRNKDKILTPEIQRKLAREAFGNVHIAYLMGYSAGMSWIWKGTQLVMLIIVGVVFVVWIAFVIYTLITGC